MRGGSPLRGLRVKKKKKKKQFYFAKQITTKDHGLGVLYMERIYLEVFFSVHWKGYSGYHVSNHTI